jgi:hypothetical protein
LVQISPQLRKFLFFNHFRKPSGSSLLCNWLHFSQETGIYAENKALRRDILCAGY